MQEPIEIPLSKTKILLLELGSIAFVAGGIWMLMSDHIDARYNPYVLKTVGVLGILFFGIITIYGAIKLFDKKPGLTLTKEGIIDNSSAVSIGLIMWDDIIDIKVNQVVSTKFLIIKVKNPDYYLDLEMPAWKRKLIMSNYKMNGAPISIASNALAINFKKLESLLKENWKQNSKRVS